MFNTKTNIKMENFETRVKEIAGIYNAGNVDWLTKMVMNVGWIKTRIKRGANISDDEIHDLVYYYEEDYNGDMFEQACFPSPFDDPKDC